MQKWKQRIKKRNFTLTQIWAIWAEGKLMTYGIRRGQRDYEILKNIV